MSGASRDGELTRIPSLDGLRAISILLVVAHHLTGAAGTPPIIGQVTGAIDAGALGVHIFFVISGFLITGILLRELQRTGSISLRRFYVRRTLRIFPAFYVFLVAVAALAAAGVVAVGRGEFLSAATYTMNFWRGRPAWELGHLWSLAVEEQFYLLWPVSLLLIGRRRAVIAAVALMIIVPPLRFAWMMGLEPRWLGSTYPFLFQADWLAVGALLALAGSKLACWARYRAVRERGMWTLFLIGSALAAWTALGHWRARELTAGWTAIAIALLIDQLTTAPNAVAARILALRPAVWLGRISYSLYLWQELFCNRNVTTWWTRFPINIALAVTFAALSYYAIERPALAWRDRVRHARY